MTDPSPRFFPDDAAVRRVGEGLLSYTLPKCEWTHEAHLAATVFVLTKRPEIDLDRDISGIIRHYNVTTGGLNDDTGGYHDTITRTYLVGVRWFLVGRDPGEALVDAVNAVLAGPVGSRDWPRRFYSRERLFSVSARRGFVPPDLAPLPESC